jgi:hypothetical protein
MAKRRIEVVLETENEKLNNNTLGIITDNTIKYNDNNIIVVVKYDNNRVVITRENDEYQLEMIFEKDKTINGNYLLKENNVNLKLEILTKDLNIEENKIEITYILNDELRNYRLYIKE